MAGALVVTAKEYTSSLPKLLALPAPHYVLFRDDDPGWCPDCTRAVPAVRSTISKAGASLLEVKVGARVEWKTPDHPFRLDPQLQLKGIPTLMAVSLNGSETGRICAELEDAHDTAQAEVVAEAFIKKTSAH